MNYVQSVVLGIIEGITEFFPISSTGHMILIAYIMKILNNDIINLYIVSVQLGSILSIIFLYRKKIFFQKFSFYIKIIIANFPVGIFGLILYKKIYFLLKNPFLVSLSMFLGGLIILKSENFYKKNIYKKRNHITYYRAFIIGLCQCISLIPGISRSGTTIVSGLLQNIDRKESIEFSFFLSIPIIIIAFFKKNFDFYMESNLFINNNIISILIGNISAFITSMISIKYFMKYLKNNDFKLFGYYRIIIGSLFIFIYYIQ
ncbi:undecaprenyl-diphosphate phosphatase [Blattabacterium cuenoti]|uniref:undecaprenyl-diphosphate phosphatase n=1 Tax=Blattabacterium cuenoti TaxID=1653831 RepID=UPI00163B65D0|nr:undecaprenyl-diphosphate phosphatase [Blattabacterium cuenoti]